MHPHFHHHSRHAHAALHGMRHGHPGGRGSREGRRRRFEGDALRLVLLKLIEEAPRHGYDLIRAIEARSGGAYAPSPGIVYPTLTLLADMGVAQESAEGARKLFAITDAGRAHLVEQADALAEALARLDALAEERSRTDGTSVRRAMHNLKSALHDRLSQPGVDRDLILQATALVDEAAAKIERL